MRVILHADDLGINQAVNQAIFGLMDEGKLTSASILANGPAFEDAARATRFFPHCSFGIHLNLTEFQPLQPSPALQPFLSTDGDFKLKPIPLRLSAPTILAVLHEWAAQFTRLRQCGVPVTHVDSHHHIHTRSALFPPLKAFCREQNVSRVRLRPTFTANESISHFRFDIRFYNWRLRRSFICTDEFGPLRAFLSRPDPFPDTATVELMVHPGPDRNLHDSAALAECYSRQFLLQHQRISYRELN